MTNPWDYGSTESTVPGMSPYNKWICCEFWLCGQMTHMLCNPFTQPIWNKSLLSPRKVQAGQWDLAKGEHMSKCFSILCTLNLDCFNDHCSGGGSWILITICSWNYIVWVDLSWTGVSSVVVVCVVCLCLLCWSEVDSSVLTVGAVQ